jgi:plastocyanin
MPSVRRRSTIASIRLVTRRCAVPVLTVTCAFGLVACGEDPSDQEANRPVPETTAPAPEETTTTAAPTTTEAPAETTLPSGDEVSIVDFAFDPAAIEIDAGTELTWTNEDGSAHSVVAADGSFASTSLDDGESFSTTFDDPGTYEYFCGIHNAMTATVVVS